MDKIPGIYDNYRYYLPIMPLAAESLKITHEADLVISSSHCVIKGVKKPKGSQHICYIHSPMRYIYDQFENYFGKSPAPIRIAANLMRPYLKWWDKKTTKNVDLFLPNSRFVQSRVQKYYNTDCFVVNPFVDLKDFAKVRKQTIKKKEYYLMVTAFAPNKRVDLAIEAFNELGYKLKIIGCGSKESTQELQEMANENIEFLGQLDRLSVIRYMAEAKAFIFPGVEDFGITPLESMAAGTTVVAFNKRGALESLLDSTASFFEHPNKDSLIEAIKSFKEKDKKDLFSRANDFSKENFISNLQGYINKII